MLRANTFNRKYWLEAGHVWMCKALEKVKPAQTAAVIRDDEQRFSDSELATLDRNKEEHVEAFIAEQSYRLIDCFEVQIAKPCPKHVPDRLMLLLERISEHCSFEKNNDSYLHTLLFTKLPARKTMILEPPFRAINHYYYDLANSITRPLMSRDGKATFDAVDLKLRSPESLASAVALLSEVLDGDVPQVAVNSGVHRHELVPFAFVGSACRLGDQLGVRHRDTLVVPAQEDPYPIATIIYQWATRFSPSLLLALDNPAGLKPGTGLYKYVI